MSDPIEIQDFGGADLINDPSEANGAIAYLNVDLDQRGRIRSRDGSTQLGSSVTSGAVPTTAVPTSFAGTSVMLTLSRSDPANNIYLDKFSTTGARTVVDNWVSAYVTDTLRFGSPTAEYVYIASAGGTASFPGSMSLVRRYDGASVVTGTGSPAYLALLPASNRVAQGYFESAGTSPTALNGSRSTVFFSDAGDPDTYSANNYVHLQPGDGEYIVAMETWRDSMFVFKQSTMFVFAGTSIDGTGQPIFNYRTVSLPAHIELTSALKAPVAAGTSGIYFLAGNAIYRTTGGEPVVVSDPIEPILRRTASSSLNYGQSEIRLSWANERLYVRYLPESGATPVVLVFDERIGQWMIWQFGSDTATGQRVSSNIVAWQGRPYYLNAAQRVEFIDPAATTDDGAAIASYYQASWSNMGSPRRKRMRSAALWGSGTVTFSVFSDRATSDSAATSVVLGTAPVVERVEQPKSREGRQFSWRLSSDAAAWNVSSIELEMADMKVSP